MAVNTARQKTGKSISFREGTDNGRKAVFEEKKRHADKNRPNFSYEVARQA